MCILRRVEASIVTVIGRSGGGVKVSNKFLNPQLRELAPEASFYESFLSYLVATIGIIREGGTYELARSPTITALHLEDLTQDSLTSLRIGKSYCLSQRDRLLHISAWDPEELK